MIAWNGSSHEKLGARAERWQVLSLILMTLLLGGSPWLTPVPGELTVEAEIRCLSGSLCSRARVSVTARDETDRRLRGLFGITVLKSFQFPDSVFALPVRQRQLADSVARLGTRSYRRLGRPTAEPDDHGNCRPGEVGIGIDGIDVPRRLVSLRPGATFLESMEFELSWPDDAGSLDANVILDVASVPRRNGGVRLAGQMRVRLPRD
jgi:hypothetical protein